MFISETKKIFIEQERGEKAFAAFLLGKGGPGRQLEMGVCQKRQLFDKTKNSINSHLEGKEERKNQPNPL